VWKRGEHDRSVTERRVIGCHERDVARTDAHPLTTLLVRGSERERKARVACDEPTQLTPRITTGAEDADDDPIHA
jgi:hypothetical protein